MWPFEDADARRVVESVSLLKGFDEKKATRKSISAFIERKKEAALQIYRANIARANGHSERKRPFWTDMAKASEAYIVFQLYYCLGLNIDNFQAMAGFDTFIRSKDGDNTRAEQLLFGQAVKDTDKNSRNAFLILPENDFIKFYIPNAYRRRWVCKFCDITYFIPLDRIYGDPDEYAWQQEQIDMVERLYSDPHDSIEYSHQPYDFIRMHAKYRGVWGALPPRSQMMVKYAEFMLLTAPGDTTNEQMAEDIRCQIMRAVLGIKSMVLVTPEGQPFLASPVAHMFKNFTDRYINNSPVDLDDITKDTIQAMSRFVENYPNSPGGRWFKAMLGGGSGGWAASR